MISCGTAKEAVSRPGSAWTYTGELTALPRLLIAALRGTGRAKEVRERERDAGKREIKLGRGGREKD